MRIAPFGIVLALAACPTGSLVGQPCDDAGKTTCEDLAGLRCDGTVWVQLNECANECVEKAKLPEQKHEGAIDDDETWSCAAGPHVVKDTMTVAAGKTLTIEAGALVKIVAAARINTDLAGRIEAGGSEEAPILVTSDSGDASGFGGNDEGGLNVFAVTSGDPSVVKHTIIERGTHGLGVFGLAADATPPVVENNTLRDNTGYGIILGCNGDAPIPDFKADGNQFFENGDGDVSACNP